MLFGVRCDAVDGGQRRGWRGLPRDECLPVVAAIVVAPPKHNVPRWLCVGVCVCGRVSVCVVVCLFFVCVHTYLSYQG